MTTIDTHTNALDSISKLEAAGFTSPDAIMTTTTTTTTMKTYIHTGGQLGDFDFLYDVIEKDKIIKLKEHDEWRYAHFKNRHIPSGSELDDALCDFVKMVKDDVIALGYGFKIED